MRSRQRVLGALVLWLVALGLMVFSPTSSRPSGIVKEWCDFLRSLGASGELVAFRPWEVAFNVAMFIPVGFLAPLVLPVRGWFRWLVIGLFCGGFVELVQAFVLPHRVAEWSDVLANGGGVLLGYLAFAGVFGLAVRRARRPGG